MLGLRKYVQLLAATAILAFLAYLRRVIYDEWAPTRVIWIDKNEKGVSHISDRPSHDNKAVLIGLADSFNTHSHASSTINRPGKPKLKGSNYTRVVVVPRMRSDDVSWIQEELPGLEPAIYVADDPAAMMHPPQNKGHEVMIYFTYIVDHYSDLPDIIIFIHAHRWTHHNIEILGYDSVRMIKRLNNEYVSLKGYVNMRCQWSPGCPEWLHPHETGDILSKQEQVVLTRCWEELFPFNPLPETLGGPCCAQFALSKERILSIPLSRFVFYRDWMLRTPLNDYVSGRIWEYLWQFLFTGEGVHCPSEHSCYCQGFGLCFGSNTEFNRFQELVRSKEMFERELKGLRESQATIGSGKYREGFSKDAISLYPSEELNLSARVEALSKEIVVTQQKALLGGIE